MDVISGLTKKSFTTVEEWVNGKDPYFFSSGLMALEHRCLSASYERAITSKRIGGSQVEISKAGYLLTRPRRIYHHETYTNV